jgi:HK97 family phage prohead protease
MTLVLPTTNLTRTASFELTRADDDSDGLTLEGYGAVFDEVTRIDSWEGRFDEQIKRGAFTKTLKERTPVIQFDHGRHPSIGSIPIAAPERIAEDAHGLFVKARLHDNELVKPVRDAIESGAITGMSFRFQVIKEQLDESGDFPLRTITEVKLFEVGPVVFPAYDGTSVGVRHLEAAIASDPSLRAELARLLGTPNPGAAGTEPEPPHVHSGLTTEARARALALIQSEED